MDKLVTYWDDHKVEQRHRQLEGRTAEDYRHKAQQQRLNKPLNCQVQVNSQQGSDNVVWVFIGPQYDAQGGHYYLEQAR